MPGRVTPRKIKEKNPLVLLAEGVYVESDVLSIVERIHETWPNLRVKYLHPDCVGQVFDAPYVVVEMLPDGSEAHVLSVWTLDERTLEMIHQADISRFRNKEDFLREMDKHNELVRKEQERIERQKREATREMVADVLRSPKDTYTAINPVTGEKHKFTSLPQSPD